MDSISGYEPLDLGSNPGTLAGLSFQSGYGVVDIMTVCGIVDPGSSPGTLAIQQGDKMKIETKKQNKKQACKIDENAVSINGIGPFCEHPRKENCWIYNGRMPTSNCWIFVNGKNVEIHNVIVYNPDARFSGYGTAMISDIRKAFPESHIWVDTWNCTRPFWQKMQHEGFIDQSPTITLGLVSTQHA